ncbi:DUF6491 family protein [Pseudoxanthomonas sp. JBR18]|uniref:DUF6491 family protein n=1 Tax=Pseudoxanthomonas sp. JBR18 TaxID=2969308 RepID=UPI002305C825|nr:DUF6491 family protein [Pseudoxanthomonas sp. JBR18]WCE03179.1 DUF6491 family protein [Pseudoxanthomonas sp. JBR18]
MSRFRASLRGSLFAFAALLSGCASLGTSRLSAAQDVELFQSHAGEPIKAFSPFGGISQWETVGDSAVAVWTKPDTAYLLGVAEGCLDLEWSPRLSLSREHDRVYAGFNHVLVRRPGEKDAKRCRIETIQPLDVQALRAAQARARPGALKLSEAG